MCWNAFKLKQYVPSILFCTNEVELTLIRTLYVISNKIEAHAHNYY